MRQSERVATHARTDPVRPVTSPRTASWSKSRKARASVDNSENLLRTRIAVPKREQARVLGELVRLLESGKHGEVEYYETPTSIVRIVIE